MGQDIKSQKKQQSNIKHLVMGHRSIASHSERHVGQFVAVQSR